METIVCFDDILREPLWPGKAFFYDLLRLPIRMACGLDIKNSPRGNGESNLLEGFDAGTFISMCRPSGEVGWVANYNGIPDEAQAYLLKFIPERAVVLTYEMTPWLKTLLKMNRIPFIDIRISPLRFARDLYLAVETTLPGAGERIGSYVVDDDEIRLEAALVTASVRCLRRYQGRSRRLDNCLIYIGQTEEDTSLISPENKVFRIEDFADRVTEIVKSYAGLLYKPHPYAGDFAAREGRRLAEITGKPLQLCHDNAYELLGSDDDLALMGISSGFLQEAEYFGKTAFPLHDHVCRFGSGDGEFLQFRFEDFISPYFWYRFLGADGPEPKIKSLPPVAHNHLRQLHNVWWGYSDYLQDGRCFWLEAFDRSGGADLRRQVRDLGNRVDGLTTQLRIAESKSEVLSRIVFGGKV